MQISIHAPPRGATKSPASTCTKGIFQFTPLREGRRLEALENFGGIYFNSRPSARGDVIRGCVYRGIELFQFTPLREGRHVRRVKPGGHPYFNSRPSARGDTMRGILTREAYKFQFTPLREGRP